MLSKEVVEQIQKEIKELNKQKDIEFKINQMIKLKDHIRSGVNEELDDLFAYLNLQEKRKIKTIEDFLT